MSDQPQANALASAFPTPPPFWQSFTPENTFRIEELRVAHAGPDYKATDPATTLPIRLLDLPAELRLLQPPEPPSDGTYRCFGDTYNLNEELPSLEEQGIPQVYTPPTTPRGSGKHSDRALILKRLAKSLLLNFLELVGIMSVNPEQYAEKVQDLRTLFINFHHLLNEYRPHQARESLILMMQDQLERSKAETEGILRMKAEVERVLESLGKETLIGKEYGGEVPQAVARKDEMEAGKDVWEELRREFR